MPDVFPLACDALLLDLDGVLVDSTAAVNAIGGRLLIRTTWTPRCCSVSFMGAARPT
jgi:hypothetical protein